MIGTMQQSAPVVQQPSVGIEWVCDMSVDQPNLVEFWAGVILFFGIGVAIAGSLAFVHVRNGGSVLGGIAMGSFAGGYGASFVFFAGHWVLVGIKRLCHRAGV